MYYMNEVIDNEYKRLSKILEYIENSEEDYSYLINRCRDIFEEKKSLKVATENYVQNESVEVKSESAELDQNYWNAASKN